MIDREMKMNLSRYVYIVMVGFLISGCANQPVGTWYPVSTQKKVSAVHHWGLIANDAAEQAVIALAGNQSIKGKPVYVSDNGTSHFEKAFRNYVIGSFVHSGVEVSATKDGAIELTYEVQVVRHGSSFDPSLFGYKPGAATAGTAGYWVLREVSRAISPITSAAVASAAFDTYKATEPTGVEVLVSASIIHQDRYILKNTDAYYIEKADAYLFEPCRSLSKRGCRPKHEY